MIDINNFDAIRIGLASPKQIRDWSSGEVTKPETINYRTLKPEKDGLFCERIFGPTKDWECYCGKYKRVRYKGIICERCGVEVTRQKVRRERMGHVDLAAPVSHIWFFKGVPSRIGYLLDIAPKELEKVLYFAASIVTRVDDEQRTADLADLGDKVKAESEQIYVDRDESLAELEKRLKRRRNFFLSGKEAGFDEDDEFWARGLSTWAEEQAIPSREDMESVAGGVFTRVSGDVTTEDQKKLRELVRRAVVRNDRELTTREFENVVAAAAEVIDALAVLRKDAEAASGAKKGSLTKRIKRIQDALLSGEVIEGDDAELVAEVDRKALAKAVALGNGLLGDLLGGCTGDATEEEIRQLAGELCLKDDSRGSQEDFDAIVQWLIKVREMYQDIELRREDVRQASLENVQRLEQTWELFHELEPKMVINDELLFRELKDRFGSSYGFGSYFEGGMGAESVRELLADLDLEAEASWLRETIKTSKGQKQQRSIKRLKVVNAFTTSENRPEWMILEAVPVIPPELRPMVQLDGGRFATSDLNDLYRRVINRNNRLKRLLDLGAPEIIVNNEKRMLQEAVDALFDNGRRGRAVTGPGNRPLKSLSDMLKGKQGRFRQNLLGKRVDYSGRSVIVAGPRLNLHQCGLPKLMALELFKPFIMSRLVERKAVQNIKAAKKYVESMVPEVWDVLEEVITEHPVLLNRAPTLHRLGIQAFEPVLVEGKAIQVHPLVCHAFNADFDGDQMAVHVPLSAEAQAEARLLMMSSGNVLSPAHGRPLATPTQDMVLGTYYLTYSPHDLDTVKAESLDPRPYAFGSEDEVILALEAGQIQLQDPIDYRAGERGSSRLTTAGRVIFNEGVARSLESELGDEYDAALLPYQNQTLTKRSMGDFIALLVDRFGAQRIASVLDTIKQLGFDFATKGGVTVSKNDIVIPENKQEILNSFDDRVNRIDKDYLRGLITEEEKHEAVVGVWTEATDKVADAMEETLWPLNPIFMMANSGARGSFKQIRQLAGMRGLMANPKGEIIERPIKANFMEGLSVREYFISTHGARKGLADTALRTADSGYLTRRLVDVSQDVIVRDEDCETINHVTRPLLRRDGSVEASLSGRIVPFDVFKPLKSGGPSKTLLIPSGSLTTLSNIPPREEEDGTKTVGLLWLREQLDDQAEVFGLPVRTVLKCESPLGVCRKCYGTFLATDELTEIGDAVGIIAAQSIGEPGTQLTMRTFHTGGVAGADITHGLPRVVEIFEARNPKGAAQLAESDGKIDVENTDRGPKVTLIPTAGKADVEAPEEISYQLPRRTRMLVAKGDTVKAGDPLHDGSLNPGELLALRGPTPTEVYLVDEVQKVYRSQGVDIHDKHIEIIVRQMMKKVRVENSGTTDLLPGQMVDRLALEKENQRVGNEKGGEEATYEQIILGITKASLATESFLSAASFQETTKVLTDAAIEGKIDRLVGLKENVIIGKLIPAATGLKRYRSVGIAPSDDVPLSAYAKPHAEEELLAALKEIGADADFNSLEAAIGDIAGVDENEGSEKLEGSDPEDMPKA